LTIALFLIHLLNAQSNKEVSNDYISIYTDLNFDKLSYYYTEDSIFEDATMSFFTQDYSYQKPIGSKNIILFLKEGFSKISNLKYDIKEQYQVGIISFYYGTIYYDYDIIKNGESKKIKFALPLAIILKIKNGKVIHHQDIVNYNLWKEQYNKQS
jgi:hypothetical protein